MKRWLTVLLILLAIALAASTALSFALRIGWARRPLLAKLSGGFGRPVEVGSFGFNPFSGFRLEAQSVTVAEDPRFGQEYFLRAEKLTASLRWSALFHGRFELGTVSLSHPSLNLVRLPDGQWNIESWLPPLPQPNGPVSGIGSPTQISSPSRNVSARVLRIEVDSGRINFKRDTRKLALALVAVTGRLDYDDGTGHWNIDLQANPLRAPAALQEVGMLRLRGVIGGVSTRLRPAALDLAWENASLADVLRLLDGADHGIRGNFGGQLSAKIADSPAPGTAALDWIIEGRLNVQGVHGWAIAGRTGDPGVSATFQGVWNPSAYRLELDHATLETSQSRVSGALDLDWSRGFSPQLQITSAHFAVADLFAWRLAFLPASENIVAEGAVDAEFAGSGWPMRIEQLSIESTGASIRLPQLSEPIRIGYISTDWTKGSLKLRPVSAFLPPSPATLELEKSSDAASISTAVLTASTNVLRIDGAVGPFETLSQLRDASYRINLSGATRRAEDLLAIARSWRGSAGSWNVVGPVSLQLALNGALHPFSFEVNGTIQARSVQIATAMLNQPVLVSSASMDLRGNQRRINLTSAEAFGATWAGSLRKIIQEPNWDFDLSTDRLDAADLNAWLGRQARPNLLRRMLPFGPPTNTSEEQTRTENLLGLQARGRLRINEVFFSPLNIEKVDGVAILDGPSIILKQGRATILGGQVGGDFQARLLAEPSFSFDGRFVRVDLREFSEVAALPATIIGVASGEIKLAAFGADRAAIARSLQGQGVLRVRDAFSSQAGLAELIPGLAVSEDSSRANSLFSLTAGFQAGGSRIRFEKAQLLTASDEIGLSGTIDFSRNIDFRIESTPRSRKTSAGDNAGTHSWTITGTLDLPKVLSVDPAELPARLPLARR